VTGIELAYLAGAVLAVVLFLGLVRRAARKQLAQRPTRAELPARDPPEPRPAPVPPSDAKPEPDDDADERNATAALAVDELRDRLHKTRGGFVARLGKLLGRKQIDQALLDELEEVLLTADIGPRTANKLFQAIKAKLSRKELDDADAIWAELRRVSREILAVEVRPVDVDAHKPFVVLMIGVNGVGKTTTIGKLAKRHAQAGRSLTLVAGDTFRAAAVEQLQVWGQRAGVPVVRGKDNADPSAVIFDGLRSAVDDGCDMVIADTAGRLHTKVDLMEELKKVRRVCDKAVPGAPHETWLVVDATTGQNAIAQAQMFKDAMDITGIVLTKLDGTAKGGVILGICDELGVPVRYIGVGEKVEDLREFDPDAFIEALYGAGTEQRGAA
jgi:fused signal recognition particle receptor